MLELLVDMIILIYMRSLRLLSIVLFVLICGPLLLVCWYKNRPQPTEDPQDLVKNLNCVKVSEFKMLRAMNYRHAPTPRASVDGSVVDDNELQGAAASDSGDMNGTHIMTNPYESQGVSHALESCCICMEDFESHGSAAASSCVADEEKGESDPNDPLMVVLPCKSHFFHLECISQWIMK